MEEYWQDSFADHYYLRKALALVVETEHGKVGEYLVEFAEDPVEFVLHELVVEALVI